MPRRTLTVLLVVVVTAVSGVAVGWALRTALRPTTVLEDAPAYSTVTVVDGSVERTLTMNATARWPVEVSLPIRAAGTVTTLPVASGATVESGDVVLTADLRPVVVALGEVPAFRDLGPGAEGPDVSQLQGMLRSEGLLRGEPDGRFGASTTQAVQRWQRQLGVPVTGSVLAGDVVYSPRLPASVTLDEALTLGSGAASPQGLHLLASAPELVVRLQDEQLDLVRAGMSVIVHPDDATSWQAEVELTGRDSTGAFAQLTGPSGTPVCGASCALVPTVGESVYAAEVQIVPEVQGPVVPSAAVGSSSTGEPFVILADGTRVVVSVEASVSGLSVVDGVEAGSAVRSPAEVP